MDESLGDFDEEIRKERERLARERDANAGGDSGAAGDAAEGSGADGDGDGSGDGSRSGDVQQGGSPGAGGAQGDSEGGMRSEGGGGTGSGGGGAGSGASKGSGPSTAPKNIPDGRDDDVIARQIREAAEKETDPELREKLWNEYIEYKKNVQGK